MTTKISGSMENMIKDIGNGGGGDDRRVLGPSALAARIRTRDALVKRGLMFQTLHGQYLLTEAGEALAATLNAVRADPQSVLNHPR
ncbi:hypothetical protein F2S72_08825 [Pseudomonas syringae pv. actinidiae]|nr:hypothetical protein [Pseudomonas syringae pv. actinidiae]